MMVLPLVPAGAEARGGSHASKPRIVWVVDDSQTDAERVRRLLTGLYHVDVFFDGASAVEQLASGRQPDVLVLDWLMPGMTGLDVCRFLRSRGSAESVRVLLLTAQRQTAQIVEGLAAGADDYLSKPYADAEMLARVASLARSKDLLERAERAEAMSRSLLEGSPDALLAWEDATGRIIFANQPAEETLGAPRGALVERSLGEVLPDLALFRVGPGRRGSIPLPDLTLNGRTYAPTARHLDGEEPETTVLSLRDVTERRLAEARRLDFYSIIAHDLRGPLGAVLMRAEQVSRGRHGPPPAGLVADMRKIESSVRSMVSLINDFLDMARLESMGYELRREPVDMRRLVQDTAEELRPLLEASGLRWEWQIDAAAEALWVLGDRRRLAQVIHNMVGNAIKFTPAGGCVKARLGLRDGAVEVAISDTGPGISPEWLPRVFQRYTRLDAGTGTSGSGLGLMIVREIVEAHGGQVGVDSTVDVGSTFWVRLPQVDKPEATPPGSAPAPETTPAEGG